MTGAAEVKIDRFYEICSKDQIYRDWFEVLSAQKKNTALAYQYGVVLFCKHCQKSPTELIQEARRDYIDRVPPWELRHIKQVEAYIHNLTSLKGKLSNNTKLNRVKGVKHFYQFYKIPVIGVKHSFINSPTESYLDIPLLCLEDIRKAVLATGIKKDIRAMILILTSSGQGQAEIRALKGKHLKNIVNGVAIVDMTREKTKRRYTFLIAPEALAAIREFKPNLRDDEFVFTHPGSNTPISPQDFDSKLSRLCDKIGLDRAYFAPHRFRHFFKSVMAGNMDSTFIEYLLGHKLPGVESAYFKGNITKMLEQYLKNLGLLTVFNEKEVLQKELDELKQKDRLESEILKANMAKREEEYNILRTDMAKIQAFLDLDGMKLLKKNKK